MAIGPFAALEALRLISDKERGTFITSVAASLATPPLPPATAAAALDAFGLDFAIGEPASLLHSVKVLVLRVASSAYQDTGAAASLTADLEAAGLAKAAADWVRETAEAAALPLAAEIRLAQAHAAANLSHDYLQDFDWQVNYVLSSSTLARNRMPLVQLQLRIRKAGMDAHGLEVTEQVELRPSELDATIASLASAQNALRALPGPTPGK